MSWFKRTPRHKTPEKPRPHRGSPISDEIMKLTKERTSPTENKKDDKK